MQWGMPCSRSCWLGAAPLIGKYLPEARSEARGVTLFQEIVMCTQGGGSRMSGPELIVFSMLQ